MDLLGKHTEGQFYAEELSPVILTKKTVYHIDKILRKEFAVAVGKCTSSGVDTQKNLIPGFLPKL
jgi:hypothetical protein